MQDGACVGPGDIEVTVEAPLGRGLATSHERSVETHEDDVLGNQSCARHAARGDQKARRVAALGANAEVARRAPSQTKGIHALRGRDQLPAKLIHAALPGTATAAPRRWLRTLRVP